VNRYRTLFIAVSLLAVSAVAHGAERDVTLRAGRMSVREFLREVGAQGNVNIAVWPGLKGYVSVDVENVTPRAALRLVLGQIGAAYCVEGNVLYVDRLDRCPCSNPEPVVQRVSRTDG
jgi:type II secretory pathway component GspD/PulD (secretin)